MSLAEYHSLKAQMVATTIGVGIKGDTTYGELQRALALAHGFVNRAPVGIRYTFGMNNIISSLKRWQLLQSNPCGIL